MKKAPAPVPVIRINKPTTDVERANLRELMARTRGCCLYEEPKYHLPWHPTTKFRVDKVGS